MFMHRWGTFLQLMSITELHNPLRRTAADQPKQFTADEAVKFTKEAQKKRSTFVLYQISLGTTIGICLINELGVN